MIHPVTPQARAQLDAGVWTAALLLVSLWLPPALRWAPLENIAGLMLGLNAVTIFNPEWRLRVLNRR